MIQPRACKACGAPVVFARMVNGGRVNPIDVTPSPNGNIRLYADNNYMVLSASQRAAYVRAEVPLYTSHFATCPEADQFRKKR